MIVREKKRTAALARTASSLDERLQAAERDASVSETAFRTYIEEQGEEVAFMSTNQQEHILSLMDLVKEETENGKAEYRSLEREKKNLQTGHDEQLLWARGFVKGTTKR